MASAARPDNLAKTSPAVLSMPTAQQLAVCPPEKAQLQQTFEEYGERTGRTVSATRQLVTKIYDETRTRALEGYGRVSYRGRVFASRVGERAQRIKQQRPLQVLGVIAATAFAAGFVVRIWRSRNS
jgi:hypothetical protein